MRLDRREFVRIGAVGGIAALGSACQSACNGGGGNPATQQSASGGGRGGGPPLQIRIQGLCIVERLSNAVAIRVINSSALTTMLPQHFAFLSVPTADIDTAATNAPSAPDVTGADATRTAFVLSGNVTLDSGNTGAPDLDLDTSPVGNQIPPNDAAWKSVDLGAKLSLLCGSTHITAPSSKFTSVVTLEHGHLRGYKPDGDYGPVTLWTFKANDSTGAQVLNTTQPMTNVLLYTVHVPGNQQPTFTIGSQKLVLKQGAKDVVLKNSPMAGMGTMCPDGMPPCLDHLSAYFELVDQKYTPTVTRVVQGIVSPTADGNYCPPGV